MRLMQRLAARQKADAARAEEMAAKRYAVRIARNVARDEAEANGLDDLPLAIAVAIELNPQPVTPASAPEDDSVLSLVARLTAIREKIWRLQAMFAVTLSTDCAMDANKYLALFQTIAAQLKIKDATALDELTRGHESLLLSPSIPLKQTVPLSTQRLVETRWEAMTQSIRKAPKPPTIPDGLDWLVG
jgi:hypothetical protein